MTTQGYLILKDEKRLFQHKISDGAWFYEMGTNIGNYNYNDGVQILSFKH